MSGDATFNAPISSLLVPEFDTGSLSGAVFDTLGTSTVAVTVPNLLLLGGTGIGTASPYAPIVVAVTNLQALNLISGDIVVTSPDPLTLENFDPNLPTLLTLVVVPPAAATDAVLNTGAGAVGSVDITTTGSSVPLTVASPVSDTGAMRHGRLRGLDLDRPVDGRRPGQRPQRLCGVQLGRRRHRDHGLC